MGGESRMIGIRMGPKTIGIHRHFRHFGVPRPTMRHAAGLTPVSSMDEHNDDAIKPLVKDCVVKPNAKPNDAFDENDVCEVLEFMAVPVPPRREPTHVSAEEVKAAISEAIDMCTNSALPHECAVYWDAAEEIFYAYMRQNDRKKYEALNGLPEGEPWEPHRREYDM